MVGIPVLGVFARHSTGTDEEWVTPTGVSSFDVSLETQQVVVKGTAPYDTVLEKIKKTGKEVRKGEVIS